MEELKNLIVENKDEILIVTINRENALNALNDATLTELGQVFEKIDDDKGVKGVIITGAGDKAFVAGADIKELALVTEVNGRSMAEKGQELFGKIERLSKPVIAVVHGFALGGGCELAMACHIRIASNTAKFGQPEINLGIIPGYGGTQRMTRLVGKGKAMELLMTGDMIAASEALDLRLVNYVMDSKEASMDKAFEILNKIKEKAPVAIGLMIDSINAVHTTGENGFQTEANSFGICCGTEDFIEGTRAFIEKRKPNFIGE
ncbi:MULTISPECIES: enoyl-CoA hydratase-related protein [Reichenbachiella]|uniref:enoyl-CoA hydratase-related protein n=1 Tax=Reichenbachiella TaxID=156993 RepID=UPI000E6BF00F|nr:MULTISPECIES: enoyl-CoA hydratase-related protein [Reichenbachiella]MBU2915893.1 enoyl-CoA hydratase/isomerase family protein [Reichenbachiella agariperforans]RJE71850.1 enoyl-CoA hydratase [Reichenbachiella sp. MSK19-1]